MDFSHLQIALGDTASAKHRLLALRYALRNVPRITLVAQRSAVSYAAHCVT
jgi:hypothetical protein